MEDLHINNKYNKYSLYIILHLIHNDESFKDAWIERFPDQKSYAENFFKNENCGCKPRIVSLYHAERFAADLLTVQYINKNPDCINWEEIEKEAAPDVTGHVFSVPATESHYQDFLASLQQKNAMFNFFVPTKINDKLLISFF